MESQWSRRQPPPLKRQEHWKQRKPPPRYTPKPPEHEWPVTETAEEPLCQREEDQRQDILDKRCQAALLDKTEKRILIIRENVPIELRRWGLPKGKAKTDETAKECSHREVCEEVGIVINDYPHMYRREGTDQVIIFYEHAADEILVHPGPEIITAKWVSLDWLKRDIKIAPRGTYNYALRAFVPSIQ